MYIVNKQLEPRCRPWQNGADESLTAKFRDAWPPNKRWPVIDDMDHLPAPSTRRIAIYISRPDSPLAANQLAAIQRYACNMGWVTVAIVERDEQRLLDLAETHALDLVLCWRTSDLRPAESLVQRLSVHSIELLAVAQSCTALME